MRDTNGNNNGLIRQNFPIDTDFTDITDRVAEGVTLRLDHSPQKMPGILVARYGILSRYGRRTYGLKIRANIFLKGWIKCQSRKI